MDSTSVVESNYLKLNLHKFLHFITDPHEIYTSGQVGNFDSDTAVKQG
ncbi:MAG: hypothetical protein KIT33_12975 [Candidatus Kapabacteria bacterium]|nr:hypothetical protein [Candidatus Kapabacteria bacterium]